jgi:hypothetical protein
MRMEIDATRIDDPVLAQEVADFSRDCYGPARAVHSARPKLDEQMHDVTWIGSRFFTDTATTTPTAPARHATTGPTTTRDAGLAQVASGWRLSDLQAVVGRWRQWPARTPAGQVDPKPAESPGGLGRVLSRAEVDDSVIRDRVAGQQKLNQGSVYTDYGGQIDKTCRTS